MRGVLRFTTRYILVQYSSQIFDALLNEYDADSNPVINRDWLREVVQAAEPNWQISVNQNEFIFSPIGNKTVTPG